MKISVSFLNFSAMETLAAAMEKVAAQKISAELELLVCDPQKKLDETELKNLCKTWSAAVCADGADPYGVLSAAGDYIAFCCEDYAWRPGKLAAQLASLEAHPECSLSIHDVEVLKNDGRPVDQNLRYRYIRMLGFEDRRYSLENLQRFDNCGFTGTWFFRNLFREGKERELYQVSALNHELRLLALLTANGGAENLFDDRFVTCGWDEKAYQLRNYPKYDATAAREKLGELENLQQLLKEQYDMETDGTYRRLHIANGAFNAFAAGTADEASVQKLMSLLDVTYLNAEFDDELPSCERSFYRTLQDKIHMFLVRKGNAACIPLLSCLENMPKGKWSYNIRTCKDKALKAAALSCFEAQEPEARKIIAEDRRKNFPGFAFLRKVWRKVSGFCKRLAGIGRKLILRRMRKKGFTSYMSQEWYNSVKNIIFKDRYSPLKQRLWCLRRGFMPWRIDQYGLTPDNFNEYLSDRGYMYLHQINNSYKKWIEDKMTFRLVLDPFKQHLPKYYFQILQRDDKQLLVRLPDLPEGFEPTFDELFRLLRQEGKLALKAASGTHGVGFYKMHYEDGKYYLNNEETTEYGIRSTINSFKAFYIVTDYINMHDQMKEIYAGSVSTIRVMMLNRDAHHPQMMDAYMRIGSVKSGVTDNVAFGGVVCTIDMETGEFGNGMQIKDHKFIRIDSHPDTGTLLQGIVPNWEIIRKGLVEICNYLPQLEYLGFDVVCTPEGFVLLEVNSHQDLHRLRYYDKRVMDFFFYKLRRKERYHRIKRK